MHHSYGCKNHLLFFFLPFARLLTWSTVKVRMCTGSLLQPPVQSAHLVNPSISGSHRLKNPPLPRFCVKTTLMVFYLHIDIKWHTSIILSNSWLMKLTCILLLTNCQHSVFTQLTESVPLSGSLICDHMERWKKIRQKYVPPWKATCAFVEMDISHFHWPVSCAQPTLRTGFYLWLSVT